MIAVFNMIAAAIGVLGVLYMTVSLLRPEKF